MPSVRSRSCRSGSREFPGKAERGAVVVDLPWRDPFSAQARSRSKSDFRTGARPLVSLADAASTSDRFRVSSLRLMRLPRTLNARQSHVAKRRGSRVGTGGALARDNSLTESFGAPRPDSSRLMRHLTVVRRPIALPMPRLTLSTASAAQIVDALACVRTGQRNWRGLRRAKVRPPSRRSCLMSFAFEPQSHERPDRVKPRTRARFR